MAVESFSAEKCRTLAARLVKNNTWLSPTFMPEAGGLRAAAARSAEFARFVPAPLRLRSARLIRMDKEIGTVQTGKLADLVLLDANPLDQIANARRIHAVLMNGRLFDRKALDELLAHLAAAGTN